MRTSLLAEPLTAHELADQQLERLRRALADPKRRPLVIRDRIDGWLDYRNSHEPGELRARL